MRADDFGDGGGEGDDVVADFGFDLVDAFDAEVGAFLDRLGRLFGDETGGGEGFSGGDFDGEPGAEAVFVAPDAGHLRAGIARDHGGLLWVAKWRTKDSKWAGRKRLGWDTFGRSSQPMAPRHTAETGEFRHVSLHDIIIKRLSHDDTIDGMKKLALADYQALAEFRYQIRKYLHFSEQAVEAAGLERGQYQLMLAIKGMPETLRPRIRDVADRMHIQHNSAVELINRLEAGGYVRRERGQDDRREVLLALTPKGEKVLGELALHHHEELRGAAPDLVAALRRLMPNSGLDRGIA